MWMRAASPHIVAAIQVDLANSVMSNLEIFSWFTLFSWRACLLIEVSTCMVFLMHGVDIKGTRLISTNILIFWFRTNECTLEFGM